MCLDIDCDGDSDTCMICLPLLCLLGYCCWKKSRESQAQGGGDAGGGYMPGYPPGYVQPMQPGYYQPGGQPTLQPGFQPQNDFQQQQFDLPKPNSAFIAPPNYNYLSTGKNQNEFKPQAGSTIVSFVQ